MGIEGRVPLPSPAARDGGLTGWFAGCGFPPEIVRAVSRLRRGRMWKFVFIASILFAGIPGRFAGVDARAVDWRETSATHRWAELTVTAGGAGILNRIVPAESGVTFGNHLPITAALTNTVYHNGSGVALGDVDGDGLCDIYFGRIKGSNALYRNLGNWRFENVTRDAGVACEDWDTTGVVLADIDGDDDLDLLVNALFRGTALFLNDGTGRFRDATAQSGFTPGSGASSIAAGDPDGDGDLDVYVTHYRDWLRDDEPEAVFRTRIVDGQTVLESMSGRPMTAPDLVGRFRLDPVDGILENGVPDRFYRNLGDGRFSHVDGEDSVLRGEAGEDLGILREWGLAAMFRDLNQDGHPDLYVCNDFFTPDRVWLNTGSGDFRLAPKTAFRHSSYYSMGVDVADIDRDGWDDVFVLDMLSRSHIRRQTQLSRPRPPVHPVGVVEDRPQYVQNMLYWNRGDGTYSEVAALAGVRASEWSWTPIFVDLDLDGFEDLIVSNGQLYDVQDIDFSNRVREIRARPNMTRSRILSLRRLYPSLATANLVFRNRGDLTFEEVSAEWGLQGEDITPGMAIGDLDNDGDPDLVLNHLNQTASLYRNENRRARIAVRLRGKAPNTRGIGARVELLGGRPPQSQEMICGGRFLSSDDPIRFFAADPRAASLRLRVRWSGGAETIVEDVRANRLYEIIESTAPGPETSPAPDPTSGPRREPLFEDVSEWLGHSHSDADFDDFGRQWLMSRKLSQLGPGVSWADLDRDGWDDLVVGSGRGGTISRFYNSRGAGFVQRIRDGAEPRALLARDTTSLLVWQTESAPSSIFVGSANYEDGLASGAPVVWMTADGRGNETWLPPVDSSTGPLAMADFDSDGDLDLFLGGRVVPGRYPEPASSVVLENTGSGRFRPENGSVELLDGIGLVSGAVWSDLTGDGAPELVLAFEWGPVRILRFDNGVWSDETARWGMDRWRGWWNSVHAGDFNGDGRMDLVAGNWGRNTKYQEYLNSDHPLEVWFGDVTGNGVVELIETYFDPESMQSVPWRVWDTVSLSFPDMAKRLTSFRAYANASVPEILGEQRRLMTRLTVTTLESAVFLNRGDSFARHPLPLEAQVAPVFGVVVADFNGDGSEDLILATNFFPTDRETTRYDGGRGLLLLGDGQGGFQVEPGQRSGIVAHGEGRGAAAADFNRDGRTDLALGQNGFETKLFVNRGGTPGHRLRLVGPPENPDAVGAILRWGPDEHQLGPAREIHCGSGYWSQDSPVQVLGRSGDGGVIQVIWPGGKVTRQVVAPGNAADKSPSDIVIRSRPGE